MSEENTDMFLELMQAIKGISLEMVKAYLAQRIGQRGELKFLYLRKSGSTKEEIRVDKHNLAMLLLL
jgi:hypothetical protein